MTGNRTKKIVVSMVLVLIVTILPTAAVLRADNAAKPMMSHDFTDVPFPGKEWMEPWVDSFYHMGITSGCSVTPQKFCPEDPLTRAAMAVFMGRALGYMDMQTDGITARAYFKQTGTGIDDQGVVGDAVNGIGVYGSSASGIGVFGSSSNSYGIAATSGSSSALHAHTTIQSTSDTIFDIRLGGTDGELFGSTLNLFSNGEMIVELDNDNNSAEEFMLLNGLNETIFAVDESGLAEMNRLVASTVSGADAISGTSLHVSGVRGRSTNGFGVYGTSTNNYGVTAESTTGNGLYAGAGVNNSTDSIYDIVLGGSWGEIFGETLYLFSNNGIVMTLDKDNNAIDGFILRDTAGADQFIVEEDGDTIINGNLFINGNYSASGSKSAIVSTVSHGDRLMYAVEATEVLFEDVGSAELIDGEAVIEIDPMFAETVNLDEEYHVFLTPVGGWADLYVAEMTETSFTVRSADGSDVQFSYRIVAKRLGYEDVRMEEVTP